MLQNETSVWPWGGLLQSDSTWNHVWSCSRNWHTDKRNGISELHMTFKCSQATFEYVDYAV